MRTACKRWIYSRNWNTISGSNRLKKISKSDEWRKFLGMRQISYFTRGLHQKNGKHCEKYQQSQAWRHSWIWPLKLAELRPQQANNPSSIEPHHWLWTICNRPPKGISWPDRHKEEPLLWSSPSRFGRVPSWRESSCTLVCKWGRWQLLRGKYKVQN